MFKIFKKYFFLNKDIKYLFKKKIFMVRNRKVLQNENLKLNFE